MPSTLRSDGEASRQAHRARDGRPFLTVYEEDLEEAANDPHAKAFLKQAYEKFERMEAEGRIIY